MVVQAAVVTGGTVERSVPAAAPARKASRWGIRPRCRMGSSTLQVAPSKPRTSSRSTVFAMKWILRAPLALAGASPCNRASRSGCRVDRGSLILAWSSRCVVLDIDDELGRIVVRDLAPLPLGSVRLRDQPAELDGD